MTISTLTEPHQDSRLAVVSDCAGQLVRTRCKEQLDSELLNEAIRTASRCGASVDSLSNASGLRPVKVREIVQSQGGTENLSFLAGLG